MSEAAIREGVLGAAVGAFVTVPAAVARYTTGADAAARLLRMTGAQLEELAAAGLPHVAGSGGPLFDYVDLVNANTFSGSGLSVPELAMRFLIRFARGAGPSWYEPRDWLVTVTEPAPPDGDGAAVRFTVRRPDLTAPGVERLDAPGTEPSGAGAGDGGGYRLAVRLTGAAQTVRDPRAVKHWDGLLHELYRGTVTYQTVPEELRSDHERGWNLGMADCIVASKVLADRLRGEGLQARARRGYLLGLLGSDHAWCELYEDGVWKTLDPVFAFGAGGGRGEERFVDIPAFAAACLGSRFNRLLPCDTEDAGPLVHVDDRPAPPWAMAGVSARPYTAPPISAVQNGGER
ncbi:hypothetical protein ABZ924_03030 [Streptomyces sp. NPDC046876]|uniref:hypothetical protein n=1 Tax=Streptomyces sp. NPDC046876 TaxID=3155616 RepID=UPI0033ECBC85